MNTTIWLGTVIGVMLTGASAAMSDEPATEPRPWSPRAFCVDNGGVVTQTGDPGVHICCYAEKHRCVSVDERSRRTALLAEPLPDAPLRR